ncbi:MAG: DNA (cytosine-5-)-methyltransferase, partial [Candidatus Paceibacterota bacterium]
TLDKSIIHPREVFAPGLEMHAAGVIIVHNHPSGDPEPSEQDKQIAKRIVEAGKLMGVNVVDFIIIGSKGIHSFFEMLQDEKKNNFYLSDGAQFSLFDVLIDEKNKYFGDKNTMAKKMKMLDLFAGIGGIKMGFEKAGFECVFSNDFDKDCKVTYDLNFSIEQKPMVLGDICKISSKAIPEFDVLTGGFPCQPFSIAGHRKGFSDGSRGNLFFEIVRTLRDKKPKAFLLENVRNIKAHDGGRTMDVIYNELEKLGYVVIDKVMNSMEYGNIPQNRERIYIVGFLDKKAFEKFSFPDKIPLTKTINDCLEKNVDEKYYYNKKPLFPRLEKDVVRKDTVYQWRRQYVRENKNNVCPTLTANMGMGGHNVPIILDHKGIRKLTPRECANFQGFPNDFRLPNIAESSLYKQFGNSVSVPVIERIALNIKKALS